MRFAARRAAVAGAHSTGKSTFLSELAAELEGRGLRVGRVADVASEAKGLGFPILRDHVYESTLWIMAQGMRKEMEAALTSDVVLVDRPVPDALGYLLAALDATGRSMPEERLGELRSIARAHAPYYDWLAITVLDEGIELGDDRDPDPAFRRAAAARIGEVVRDLAPEARRLTPSNRDALRNEAVALLAGRA